MQTVVPSFLTTSRIRPHAAPRSTTGGNLLFVLVPLVLIGITLCASEHHLEYATARAAGQDGASGFDLAADAGGGSVGRQITFIAMGAFGAALLLKRASQPVAVDKLLIAMMILFCAWIVLSAFWADEISLSLKRSTLPVLTLIASLGFAKHWQPRQLCQFTALLSLGFLVFGVAAECASGSFLRGVGYRFGGTLDPNMQAVNCAALCLAATALYRDARSQSGHRSGTLWLLLGITGLLFLLLTRSRSTTFALLVTMVVVLPMGASQLNKLTLLGITASMIVLFGAYWLLAGSSNAPVMQVVEMGRGQDANEVNSLTGRIPIWTQVIRDISEQPLIGYGYGSFWTAERVLSYFRILNWEFNHAHSAYLETMLNIGAIGLALGLVVVARAYWLARRRFTATEDCGYWFVIAVLTLAPIQGLLDSNFVSVGFASILGTLCIALVALHGGQPESVPSASRSASETELSDGQTYRPQSFAQA